MGQFSVEKPVLPGSALSGNQQGAEYRDDPGRNQDAVDAGKPQQEAGWILSRHCRDAPVSERLNDEDNH
ncbi:MAG TPA: hypothetical protein VMH36_27265, partial [Alphaproteobacteria bacterium]|nr:hypothetical protein [Alphaproteobacteria bacterium]